jgi:formamidopyrimidine-DNA glycosylase
MIMWCSILLRADGRPVRVVFNDPRRFGFMLFAEHAGWNEHPLLAGLGVEPTGNRLDGPLLNELFRGQAGSAESRPARPEAASSPGWATSMSARRCGAPGCRPLARSRFDRSHAKPEGSDARRSVSRQSIREVIADAIAAGGSSLRDYVQADGSLGYFQHSFSGL